ncbi:uncharacterized protein LOC116139923 [Pistacia vera]|uniref:uncharacterized protein LOC116139917 n=1 Tax=Pistacia vera TaxID=55513 RepID=UPI001262BF9A|nr:uncharacterized protein LOC116139917 [Pistacia vera]XP_031281425.1 uncharacterized protein LOC116139923 [Pistacia vera]
MANTKPKVVKQLGQFLQEQQEPFILEIYLSERGYQKKNLNSESSTRFSQGNSSKSLKGSGNTSPNKSKKVTPQFSKVLRAAYKKFTSIKDSLRIKNNDNRNGQFSVTEMARNSQEVAEPDGFSTASSTTVFNSCSDSEVEETSTSVQKNDVSFIENTSQSFKLWSPGDKEAAAEGKLQWRCVEDSKQISPVSVLEEITSHRGSSPDKTARQGSGNTQEENPSRSCITLSKKITEDSILSTSFWSILFHSAIEKPSCAGATETQEPVHSKSTSQFFKSKKVVQQTEQLLFDCVREVLESHGKERRQQNKKEFLGSELLGNLVCEKIKAWGKQSVDGFNITQLLNADIQDSIKEWNDFEAQQRDIALEIGDAILEEIKDQIVTEMLYFSKI